MSRRITVADYAAEAMEMLDPLVLNYYRSGADAEHTLRENEVAYTRIKLLPRVLRAVADRDTATTVLGIPIAAPMMVAPTAMQKMAHPEGELGTARAASDADTVMVLSTLSNTAVEEVAAARRGPVWFQLYVARDRSRAARLVKRAEVAGCSALVLTVDAPVIGLREADARGGFTMPSNLHLPNVAEGAETMSTSQEAARSALEVYASEELDADLDWGVLEWLQGQTQLPIVVKGILHPLDAVKAVDLGAAAVVVSNHGGRQLDTVPATIDVLPSIVDAVDGRAEIYLDGGIRRGTDIFKALALGARAVLIGRPILWGLAVDGTSGASHVLKILTEEFDRAMALSGCRSVSEITRDCLFHRS